MRLFTPIVFLASLVLGPGAGATTWQVNPEGTGDAPTILAAIDSCAAGDVIELACGTYHESTTMATMLILKSGLTIRSAAMDPACVTIDAQQPMGWGSVFYLANVSNILFQGLTITGGDAIDSFLSSGGGGAYIWNCSAISFEDCVITGNRGRWGGGLLAQGSEVQLNRCIITDNVALAAGGGLGLVGYLEATDCRILDNTASPGWGGDGFVSDSGTTGLLNCCEKDLEQWITVEGASLLVEDEGCGPVLSEGVDWAALKAMFR